MSKAELMKKLYEIGALKFGEFILKSGKKSPYYIDLRILPSHPDVLLEVAKGLKAIIENQSEKPTVLCGVPMAGLAIANVLGIEMGIPVVYTRKEPIIYKDLARQFRKYIQNGKFQSYEISTVEKVIELLEELSGFKTHGVSSYLDGEIRNGDKILIVDDLITTADSKLETLELITLEAKKRNLKVKVLGVCVVIDREQGGRETLEKAGLRLYYLATMSEIARILYECGSLPAEKYKLISEYIASEKAKII